MFSLDTYELYIFSYVTYKIYLDIGKLISFSVLYFSENIYIAPSV